MQLSRDRATEVSQGVASWERCVANGDMQGAHDIVTRLITLLRVRSDGLDALVSLCEASPESQALTAALIRQLCCSAPNSRGGLHARKYALSLGLSVRWNTCQRDDELSWVYAYWQERLRWRRMAVGALGGTIPVDLLTQARFLVDHLMAPVQPEIVPRYKDWLSNKGLDSHLDDTLCWMFDSASVQTLWVTAQSTASHRRVHLAGTPDEGFMLDVHGQVQQAWYDAVDEFLARWTTPDPLSLSVPKSKRSKTPWVSPQEAEQCRSGLRAALQVTAPLEPYAAWQRQRVQGFLQGLTDSVFYSARPTGLLSLSPQDSKVLAVAWTTTPRPSMVEWAKEFWNPAPLSEEDALPAAVRDVIWQAAQRHWEFQGEMAPVGQEESLGMLHSELAHGLLELAWTPQVRQWCVEWFRELPQTVQLWIPEEGSEVLELPDALSNTGDTETLIPVPPGHLLQAGSRASREAVATDRARVLCTLEEAVFGDEGCKLVTSMSHWDVGFAKAYRRESVKLPMAFDAGPEVAQELGMQEWIDQALTGRGRSLVGGWLNRHSPLVLEGAHLFAQRLALEPPQDAFALAQWMRASVLRNVTHEDFAWTLNELLHPAEAVLVKVSRASMAVCSAQGSSVHELQVKDLLAFGQLGYAQFETPSLMQVPREEGYLMDYSRYLRGAHFWVRHEEPGRVVMAFAFMERTVVDVKPGDRLHNSVLLGDGRRERTVDRVRSFSIPVVDLDATLAELLAEHAKVFPHMKSGAVYLKAGLQTLARLGVLLRARQLVNRAGVLATAESAQAVTLEEAFRIKPSGAKAPAQHSSALEVWRLEPADVPKSAVAGAAPSQATRHVSASLPDQVRPAPALSALREAPLAVKPLQSKASDVVPLSLQERLHLGQILRQARGTLKLTAREVADSVFGFPTAHAAVCRFERGCVTSVAAARLQKLLAHYGMELEQVLGRCRRGDAAWTGALSSRGARLKAVREALALTPEEFVQWSTVPELSVSQLRRVEAGLELAPDDWLVRLCEQYPKAELSLEWLRA